MCSKNLLTVLFLGANTTLLAMAPLPAPTPLFPLRVEVRTGEEHAVWSRVVEKYDTLQKELEERISNQPEVYKTADGKAAVDEIINNFARFAEGTAEVAVLSNGKADLKKFPRLQHAATKQEIARRLLTQAISTCNVDGIKFLTKRYGLNPNDAILTARSALDSLGKVQQLEATPVQTLQLLKQCGLDVKRHVNTWNIHGETPVHQAATYLVANYRGLKNPEEGFKKLLLAEKITLPDGVSQADEVEKWVAVREEAIKNLRDLIVQYKKDGAQDIPNKKGKKASEILKECAREEGPCKEAYNALVKSISAATTPAAGAASVALAGVSSVKAGYFAGHETFSAVSKALVVTAVVATAGYLCHKLYAKIRQSQKEV